LLLLLLLLLLFGVVVAAAAGEESATVGAFKIANRELATLLPKQAKNAKKRSRIRRSSS